jgi:hypothetical protein
MNILEWSITILFPIGCLCAMKVHSKKCNKGIDTPIKIEITLLGGWYKGHIYFGENNCKYSTTACSTYEKCFYDLIDVIKKDRYTNLMDHNFTVTFINKSHIKEVG